jgi:hypothetical protein
VKINYCTLVTDAFPCPPDADKTAENDLQDVRGVPEPIMSPFGYRMLKGAKMKIKAKGKKMSGRVVRAKGAAEGRDAAPQHRRPIPSWVTAHGGATKM